ncbi:MAG: YlxR family protein [Bacilli bacterium]|nr:YlxR family protein [Bacilli bacterium]
MRSCVVTREKCEKKDLLRVVRTPEGNVILDETGKANGRGAYLKKDKEVIEKAMKNNILDKILEVNVPSTVYEEMLNKIN